MAEAPLAPLRLQSFEARCADFVLLVHGGAGKRAGDEPERARAGCLAAARAGAEILRAGGSALDAVQRAVEVLEDDPQFNAGTGGSLTWDGALELDAAIMDGRDLRAGGVCCLPPYRNPIAIARAVLNEGRHVLYASSGADALARRAGFLPEAPSRMITQAAIEKLERFRAAQSEAAQDPSATGGGTVGAVARDRAGHVAAATSTGGVTGKRSGRVGDSPILGAGTYADDLRGAASATGFGEGILRVSLSALVMSHLAAGKSVGAAAREALQALRVRVGTDAGIIVVAPDGGFGLAHSTQYMPWAVCFDRSEESGAGPTDPDLDAIG
jgi:beta-aspartyl-peptidase (threonine type)